jgi:hypothetical protein
MNLTETQKKAIEEKYDSMDPRNIEFEDAIELIVDYLLDEEIVDISDDEHGDAHEDLHNTVWEYIDEYAG